MANRTTGRATAAWMGLALAAALVPAIGLVGGQLSPFWNQAARQAAMAAAALSMPEGTLALLEERFKGDYIPRESEPSSSGQNSAPPVTSSRPQPAKPPKREESNERPVYAEKLPIKTPAAIPAAYRGHIVEEDLSGASNPLYLPIGAGWLRNYTTLTDEEIKEELAKPLTMVPETDGSPQVLIIHTHATEAFEEYDTDCYDTRNTWRSTDNTMNMVAVGEVLAQILKEQGISVLHDTTQHDYPSYNGAYERSAQTVKRYLEEYPSIKIVLDVHRDGIQRSQDTIVKVSTEIDGQKAAQLMIITGCDDGTMDVPKWSDNLRFAAALQNAIEEDWPTLTRPIFFCYRKYNMDLTQGSVLLEMGSHGNTLEEVLYTAKMTGYSLARLLHQLEETGGMAAAQS